MKDKLLKKADGSVWVVHKAKFKDGSWQLLVESVDTGEVQHQSTRSAKFHAVRQDPSPVNNLMRAMG